MAESLKEIIKKEYVKCATDPVYFIRKYCMIQHPMKGKIPFHLYPFQQDVLEQFMQHNRLVLLKSRQLGLSTLIAGYALWLILFHNDKNCLVVAIDQGTSKNLVTKVRVMYDNLPSWLRIRTTESNKLSIKLANGSQIKAVASTGTSGRSEALSLAIIDEAGFVENAEELWASINQTLATGGQGIILSTPNGVGNWFHKMWSKALTGEESTGRVYKGIRLPWSVHPERDQSWRDQQDEELGPKLAAQECDCDFLTSGNSVVSPDVIGFYEREQSCEPQQKGGFDNNYWIWKNVDYTKNYIVSADVARGDGTDYSTFHVIEVENMEQVASYRGQCDTKMFGNMLVAVATAYNDALLVIENANVGWAAIQQVIERSYKNLYYSYKDDVLDSDRFLLRGFDLNSKANSVAGFTNSHKVRPLMISKMELYMREKQVIIRDRRLLDELYVFVYRNGRPEALQGYNDDLVMAYAQALWVRDTALKLRQAGIELNRAATSAIRTTTIHKNTHTYDPFRLNLPNGSSENLNWLL